MKLSIHPEANTLIHTLQEQGYEAFVVGGCVRNALLGLHPHDWDICTNATPSQMREVFRGYETVDFGLKHGTLVVMAGKQPYEVTTYRVDGVYADNRHPEQVTFTDSLALDLSRRDFTVNAMAYNDEQGLVDPFGGAEDLRCRRLRCVGVPDNRFHEDALRILRGVRFAAVYGFSVEEETAASLHRCAPLLRHIAAERVASELTGALCGAHVAETLDVFRDVAAVAVPELTETFDFPQRNKHHRYDVWRHILRRLRFPNAFIEDCLALIVYHDVRFNGTTKQVRRVLSRLGEVNTRRLFAVQRADIAAQSAYRREEKLASVAEAERLAEEILAQRQCLCVKDLAVGGRELLAAGVPEGRAVGRLLNTLLDEVLDETLPNEREALLARACVLAADL